MTSSLGELIAMKLIVGRQRDIADIVELIKTSLRSGEWDAECERVTETVKGHLGVYAAKQVRTLTSIAREELKS